MTVRYDINLSLHNDLEALEMVNEQISKPMIFMGKSFKAIRITITYVEEEQ